MLTDNTRAARPMVFDSIDEMLALESLRSLTGLEIKAVERDPYVVAHRSANELFQIRLETNAGTIRLILKEFQPQRDWVMRLTHDVLTREAMLYVHGLYARMPPEIVTPVIAAARHGDTWANLMLDVSSDLLPLNVVTSSEDARLLITHLAALHAHFWDDPELQNPALGLSSLEDFLTVLAPARVQAEIQAGRAHPVMELAARGWSMFETSAPSDVVETIHSFQKHPERLRDKLVHLPKTLVHGDYKLPNLGLDRRQRAIVLDWQDATAGFGALDLGYFLALNARWLPFDLPVLVDIYVAALGAHGYTVSSHSVDLALVAGGALRLLWLMSLDDHNNSEWWYDLIRRVAAQF